MDKLTKKQYLDNLQAVPYFQKAGYCSCAAIDVQKIIISKDFHFADFAKNYICSVTEVRSKDMIYRENGENIFEALTGKYYRFYHNDVCYLIHEYSATNTAIKVLEG